MISVIVPIYNVENYLEECLESILVQTYSNLEIILVDDGSTDNSGNICELYSKKDSRIKVIHKKNGGTGSARNIGLKIAKGKYISFVDSDDFLLNRNVYSEMISIMDKENSDLVFGDVLVCYSNTKTESLNELEKKFTNTDTLNSDELLLMGMDNKIIFSPVCFYIYKKELLDINKIYFREDLSHEDEEFTIKLLLKGKKVSFYKKTFYGYKQTKNSKMRSNDNPEKGKDLIKIAEILVPYLEEVQNKELKRKFGDYISRFIINSAIKYKFDDISDSQIDIVNKYSYSKLMRISAKLMKINLNLFYFIENKYRKFRKFIWGGV